MIRLDVVEQGLPVLLNLPAFVTQTPRSIGLEETVLVEKQERLNGKLFAKLVCDELMGGRIVHVKLCMWDEDLTLSLPTVINFKFPLHPHHKYYITLYGDLAFDSLLRWKTIIPILTTSLTHLSLRRVGECAFLPWEWKVKEGGANTAHVRPSVVAYGNHLLWSDRTINYRLRRPLSKVARAQYHFTWRIIPHVRGQPQHQ